MRYVWLSLFLLSCSESPSEPSKQSSIPEEEVDVYSLFENYLATVPDSVKENYDEELLWVGFEAGYNSYTEKQSSENLSEVIQKMEDEQDEFIQTIEELKEENQRLLRIKTSIQNIMENE